MELNKIYSQVFKGEALTLEQSKVLVKRVRQAEKGRALLADIRENWLAAMEVYMGYAGLSKEQIAKDMVKLKKSIGEWLDSETAVG